MKTRIQNAYGVGGPIIPVFPTPILAERAPVNHVDVDFPQGQAWWDNSANPRVEYIYNGNGVWDTADLISVPNGVLVGQLGSIVGYPVSQYNVIVGATDSGVAEVSPGTAGYVLTSNGPAANPSFQAISSGVTSTNVQVFTSDDSYIPSAGLLFATIECVGGGGGGGGAAGGSTFTQGGGGGQAGSYSRVNLNAATIGASQTITVGAGGAGGAAGGNDGMSGGTTSFGVLCTAGGGSPGIGGNIGGAFPAGGFSNNSGTGDFSSVGAAGSGGFFSNIVSFPAMGGGGGSSIFGGGAPTNWEVGSFNGTDAYNYGSGGSGGFVWNANDNVSGGKGSDGIVIITEYLS